MWLSNSTTANSNKFFSDWYNSIIPTNLSDPEAKCIQNSWWAYKQVDNDSDGLYCDAVWDEFYCWPFTPAGKAVTRSCSLVFQNTYPFHSEDLAGNASRFCLENGTWLEGPRTDYTECAISLISTSFENDDELPAKNLLVEITKYTIFIGSILSSICLGLVLGIFSCFRNVWVERIKIHVNLMLAMLLRSIVLMYITEPFSIRKNGTRQGYNLHCKVVLIAHLHSTVNFVNWTLIQGIYLNEKLTYVFATRSSRKFLVYCCVGWGFPLILILIYLIAMIINHPSQDCWHGYSEMKEIQILLIPTILALLVNGLLLCNILRIIKQRGRILSMLSETCKVTSIAKASLMLFPILGLNNLVFIYNPGGDYEKIYVVLNTFFGSTQGVLVAVIYWLNCTEVHEAIRRSYMRFLARNDVRRGTTTNEGNEELRLSTMLNLDSSPNQVANENL